MNLDDLNRFRELDQSDMLKHIDALPDQLEAAWARAQTLDLPASFGQVNKIVICGMGGSAISSDLVAALVEEECAVPIIANRNGKLPTFAGGQDTLVIAISFSGNTAETLSAFEMAYQRGAQLMALTTGGRLADVAQDYGATLWTFDYASPPRAALGWLFGMLLGALVKTGLVVDKVDDVADTVAALRRHRKVLTVDNPAVKNPAKRYAGQFMGRIAVVYGAGLTAPVARRWKCQINENGKHWSHFEVLPELNHNAVVGTEFPEQLMTKLAVIQLSAPEYDPPDITLRHSATTKLMLQQAILVDSVKARGKSRLENMFNVLQFGDYVSYYVAMGNGVDPTPIPQIDMFKEMLKQKKPA
jgi:glucose/mannose-6-phosphate isomerase